MKQNGFILVVSLIFLVLMTLLGLAMFGGFTTNTSIAGNLREKSRATDSAEAAIDYAEYWLLSQAQQLHGSPPLVLGSGCTTPLTVANAPAMNICPSSVAMTIPASVTWGSGVSASPPANWNLYSQEAPLNAAYPIYYVQFVGTTGSTQCQNQVAYYQITAVSPGGNSEAMAVVQSIYSIRMNTTGTSCS